MLTLVVDAAGTVDEEEDGEGGVICRLAFLLLPLLFLFLRRFWVSPGLVVAGTITGPSPLLLPPPIAKAKTYFRCCGN